jgi:hypothetical protein
MSNTVDLQFQYSEKEYVQAAQFYLRKTYHTRFNIAVGLLVANAGLMFWFLDLDPTLGYIFTFLGALLLLIYCRAYFALPRQWYERNPKLHEEYHLQFSDEEIVFRSKDVVSTIKWDFYRDVWETDQFYFLLYGKDTFSLIPKRAFAGDWQERTFKHMLEQHITFNAAEREALEPAREHEQEYVPKSLEPPDWR